MNQFGNPPFSGSARMYAGSYVVNPYTTVYGDDGDMGGYMTVYGAEAEYGTGKKAQRKLKRLARKLAHASKVLAKTNNETKQKKLKLKIQGIKAQIAYLKGKKGAEADAAADAMDKSEGGSDEGSVQLPDGRKIPRKLLRKMRGAHGHVRRHPRHPGQPDSVAASERVNDGGMGRMGRRGRGMRDGIPGRDGHPGQRDGHPGRGRGRQHPGMQSQGPISASEVQAAQTVDMEDVSADIDMEDDMALAGMFDMGKDMDMGKILLYGGLIVGGIYLFSQMKKR